MLPFPDSRYSSMNLHLSPDLPPRGGNALGSIQITFKNNHDFLKKIKHEVSIHIFMVFIVTYFHIFTGEHLLIKCFPPPPSIWSPKTL